MRPDTKLKLARRKHTLELLKWLYARRKPQLDGTKISREHRRGLKEHSRSLTYGEVIYVNGPFICIHRPKLTWIVILKSHDVCVVCDQH